MKKETLLVLRGLTLQGTRGDVVLVSTKNVFAPGATVGAYSATKANAVMFFITRQTPTAGSTIPVDGGLPDATPR
ncbi:MAG: hypothetical protein ABFS38_06085 [Bacteroidota bacterium]